jgi:FtsX-like permease family
MERRGQARAAYQPILGNMAITDYWLPITNRQPLTANQMVSVVQDFRYAIRLLLKSPGFTVVAVLTLGAGIGANVTVFSVLHAVLVRSLPLPKPQQLARSEWEPAWPFSAVSAPDFSDWRERNTTFVAQRTGEIAVRAALGARRLDIFRLVLAEATQLMAIGIGAGLFASLFLTRLMQGLVYGVGTADPQTFLGVIVLLVLIGLVANYVPAHRAMNINPTMALREE